MDLISVAENLWTATQPFRYLGLEVGTRMTIIRLGEDLILISPIQLQTSDCPTLNALGTVRHLMAPNRFHYLFLNQAQELYPDAVVWGVEGLAEKQPELKLDALLNQPGNLGDDLDYLPIEGFGALLPRGIALAYETVFWHRPSRSLILTDIAFNFDASYPWGTQLAARMIGTYGLKPSKFEKWGTRDKAKVKASIQQVLAWDFDRVIPAHGSIVETDGKAQLRAGFEWFLGEAL